MNQNASLPPIVDVIVELGVPRMRMAIGSATQSYIPRMCLWVERRRGMVIHFELTEPLESYVPVVVQSLAKVAKRINGFPRQIQLRNVQLANELRPILGEVGIEVVVREWLPKLDDAVAHLMDFKRINSPPEPCLLDVPGITLDHVIAFADAAKQFYEVRPWQYLCDDDLIAIESPAGPVGTQFTQVLGAGGVTFGLGFVASRKAHEEMRNGGGLPRGGIWSLLFGPIDEIPYDDGEAWERHGLTVASPTAYPRFVKTSKSKGISYPTPQELDWAEGLLKVIACTTESELDQGRWEKTVATASGAMTFKLSLPLLLEQMSGVTGPDPAKAISSAMMLLESTLRTASGQLQAAKPATDTGRSQALCYQAYDARGRQQRLLVRQALEIDPDCVEALLLTSEWTLDEQASIAMLERAVASGARRLGPDVFEAHAGRFWLFADTRPYMRARQRLAQYLMDAGKFDEAADHLSDMLRLSPGDNQGNRYLLAQALLISNQLDDLDKLLNEAEYKDDFSAEWKFTRALLEYRRKGDAPEVRNRLDEAQQSNQFVVPLLTGRLSMPPGSPQMFSSGSKEEAVVCVNQIAEAWHETPGALEWLASAAKVRKPKRSAAKKRKPK